MNLILYLLFMLFFQNGPLANGVAYAAENSVSAIEEVKVRQIGGDKLLLEISGRSLQHPLAAAKEGVALCFIWQNTTLAGAKARRAGKTKELELKYDYPLVRRIILSANKEENIVEMLIIGERHLRLKSVGGIAGSDVQTLLLETLPPPGKADPVKECVPQSPLNRKDKVTLEMSDVSTIDALRALAALANLNLVADKTVPNDPITLSFKDAPFGQVLGWLLRANRLSCSVAGGTLIVGSAQSVAEIINSNEIRA